MLVIDTCSLISLVRYYLLFDANETLFNFVKNKVEKKEIIVIDKVYDECCVVAKGIVDTSFPFLKKNQTKTIDCLPDKNFFHLVNNDYRNRNVSKRLTEEEFEREKNMFLEGADAKMILFCKKNLNLLSKPRIITEETEGSNDNKHFKKIPTLCRPLDIETITMPSALKELDGIEFIFK